MTFRLAFPNPITPDLQFWKVGTVIIIKLFRQTEYIYSPAISNVQHNGKGLSANIRDWLILKKETVQRKKEEDVLYLFRHGLPTSN